MTDKLELLNRSSSYLRSGHFRNSHGFPFAPLRIARFGRWLQNSGQPLLPATPKVLHVVVGSPGQIGGYAGPPVPKPCLQVYHHSLFLCRKLAPTSPIVPKFRQSLFTLTRYSTTNKQYIHRWGKKNPQMLIFIKFRYGIQKLFLIILECDNLLGSDEWAPMGMSNM